MTLGVFDPQGPIAAQERDVIITAVCIMLVVAIPMLIALYTIAIKYRAGKKNAKYAPEHAGSAPKQLIWWVIPAIVIVAISILDWKTTHAVDPTRAIASSNPPLTIQVVALEWKFLFIYPQQGIATVNYLEFPEQTPIHFELTADAPMSSFWIPQLGSQIYAMAAMQTQINLLASTTGVFDGKNTEINGMGYAGMAFKAHSVSQSDFNNWVAQIQQVSNPLTTDTFNTLDEPSSYVAPGFYSSFDSSLYDDILMKYMMPSSTISSSMTMPTIPAPTPPAGMQGDMIM